MSERSTATPRPFDPDAAAKPGAGVFGLPFTREESRIILLPVPFDPTTSYGGGASRGPEAIRRASSQVDLFDLQFGRVYEAGIFMEEVSPDILTRSRGMRLLAGPIIEKGGAEDDDADAVARINAAGAEVNEHVRRRVARILADGKTPGLVGGDHSTPFGAIQTCAEHVKASGAKDGLGVLQIDAHMDLREAFEGFTWSHASIMWNVITRLEGVASLIQIGLRDVGEGEIAFAKESNGRIRPHFDLDWRRRIDGGERFAALCNEAIAPLPKHVYISFDIDGLDPSLCPSTGTPVPGGLSFVEACLLLEILKTSGRTIIGFDLCEVCPAPGDDSNEWDANVGARILYKLCGAAV